MKKPYLIPIIQIALLLLVGAILISCKTQSYSFVCDHIAKKSKYLNYYYFRGADLRSQRQIDDEFAWRVDSVGKWQIGDTLINDLKPIK